jgi:hypothetical protein
VTTDAINGAFECVGGLLIVLNCHPTLPRQVRERRHGVASGTCYIARSSINGLSFAGGVLIVLANTVWIAMAVHYGSR